MTQDTNTLKPCPFCGGKPFLRDFGGWEIHCYCGIQMILETPEQAPLIPAWNRRATPTQDSQPTEAYLIPSILTFVGTVKTNCPDDVREKLEGTVVWTPELSEDDELVVDKHGVSHRPIPLCKKSSAPQAQDSQQAKIDALMLEHRPEEMTPAQIQVWAANQKPVAPERAGSVQEPIAWQAKDKVTGAWLQPITAPYHREYLIKEGHEVRDLFAAPFDAQAIRRNPAAPCGIEFEGPSCSIQNVRVER